MIHSVKLSSAKYIKKLKNVHRSRFTFPKIRRIFSVISCCCFAKDGKEMHRNLQRTCKAIVNLLFGGIFVAVSVEFFVARISFQAQEIQPSG